MLGLTVFRSETEQPEQLPPAIQIAGYSTICEDTVILLPILESQRCNVLLDITDFV